MAALAGGAALCALAALAIAVVSLMRARRVQRAYAVFSQGRSEDVLTLLRRHIDEVTALRGEVVGIEDRVDGLRRLLSGCVSRVATVRYDAFDEVGGQLSFSSAMIDERGDGVVFTAIHGRNDSRSYAKPIRAGESQFHLSDEERQVLRVALETGPVAPVSSSSQGDAR
ncbi:DUF4446 family protein [Egibacter rhizosphaerae]|uniref:DUF4446 family protein n=1 Tax=Egibacter rhizosphaerae TaxID=1670831 RepID=A0A411YEU3_9ACTN|nr:DUF4446 family protein [Egibacter rhizosphaerae]QBI19711.1 DUF4446 family protein [Egibacter rhizosphaerae]